MGDVMLFMADVLDPSLNSLSINFQNLPESEPELSFALIKRLVPGNRSDYIS